MKLHTKLTTSFLFSFILLIGCRKSSVDPGLSEGFDSLMVSSNAVVSYCIEEKESGVRLDSVLKPTLLGARLVGNPYSLTKMQQAYVSLYGSATGVGITHHYVRFKPSTFEQLSTLSDLDIDLFDYPLDYEVAQQGDYYNDGVTPAEQIPWQYAVVPSTFSPPAGITYELLEQIHVPTLGAVESEAFRITGNPIDNNVCSSTTTAAEFSEPPGGCPPGTHFSGGRCVPDGPAPPPPPAPVRQPSGTVTVFDNNLNVNRPVRNARIVARRYFKVERTFTNNQGQFFINKEFNKVRLSMKLKNDQAIIRSVRRARLWQGLYAVEVDLGKFRGTLNNIQHFIAYIGDARSIGARSWAACTANNAVQEYRDLASAQGVGLAPNKLRILLTNWRYQGSTGAAPMYAKRFWQTLPGDFLTTFVIGSSNAVAGGITALAMVYKAEIDITAGYNAGGADVTSVSDALSETLFHEQAHASHYAKVGNTYWATFINSVIAEIAAGPQPYGRGNPTNSPIIALCESWAYHLGHVLADAKYGTNSRTLVEQGVTYRNGTLTDGTGTFNTGLNAHMNLLEDFSPVRANDPFRWIPQGLYNDLLDNRVDGLFNRVLLNDQVQGYTNQGFFNALDQDILNLPSYRLRLLSENANN